MLDLIWHISLVETLSLSIDGVVLNIGTSGKTTPAHDIDSDGEYSGHRIVGGAHVEQLVQRTANWIRAIVWSARTSGCG